MTSLIEIAGDNKPTMYKNKERWEALIATYCGYDSRAPETWPMDVISIMMIIVSNCHKWRADEMLGQLVILGNLFTKYGIKPTQSRPRLQEEPSNT